MASSSYRAQLNAWYNQISRDYQACIPQGSFSLNFNDSQASDWDLYREAQTFYNGVLGNWYRAQQHEDKPKKYHLRSVALEDGSAYFIDMKGNNDADVKLIKRKDGLYDFIGTQQGFERVGGRGILADIINKLDDGDYFHSRKYQHKKAA